LSKKLLINSFCLILFQ